MKTGIELIAQERFEQIEKHGYRNDSHYTNGVLTRAACAICYDSELDAPANFSAPNWAWEIREQKQAKPNEKIERLKVAGALIAAEIDRLLLINGTYEPTTLQTESIFWPCPNCNQDTNSKEWIICCSQNCLKQWLEKTNIGK